MATFVIQFFDRQIKKYVERKGQKIDKIGFLLRYIFCSKLNCIKSFLAKKLNNEETWKCKIKYILCQFLNTLVMKYNTIVFQLRILYSSLEFLCNMVEGKCRTEKITKKVNCQMKTFYLPKILVFDFQVTKTSDKSAKNSSI